MYVVVVVEQAVAAARMAVAVSVVLAVVPAMVVTVMAVMVWQQGLMVALLLGVRRWSCCRW